jgi:hypothetical protein
MSRVWEFSCCVFTLRYTVIVSTSAKFCICTVVGLNVALVEEKMRTRVKSNKCPIYAHDGASAMGI